MKVKLQNFSLLNLKNFNCEKKISVFFLDLMTFDMAC